MNLNMNMNHLGWAFDQSQERIDTNEGVMGVVGNSKT